MANCKTLPSLEEIGAAYDVAFEVLPDNLLGTVEGRREFISSALNYLKDNCAVVPSNQSLKMIVKELISYDTECYEGAMEFADNVNDVETFVTENWNEVSIEEDTKNIAPEANDFPQAPIPSLRDGLSTIFDNINDQERFIRIYQNDIVRFSFVNYNGKNGPELVSTTRELNVSIRNYKNELFQSLARDLNQPVTSMYIGETFQVDEYNKLINNARIFFYPHTLDGVFKSDDINIINAYNKFVMLTNFDNFLYKHSKDLIQVARGFMGGHIEPRAGYKYTYNLGKHIKQDYNNELQDMNEHVNGAVQLFINSLPILDIDGKPTGQFVEFKTFQSLIRIFRNISESNDGISKEIRNNPREAIKEIVKIAYNNRRTYFTGNDATLYPAFNSIYHYVFDKNNPSSLASLESSITSPDQMNIYSMVLNHINKTSPVSYLQYKYSTDTGAYVVSYLDSEAISQKQSDLEKHLMIQSKFDNYTSMFADHGISINEDQYNQVVSVNFNIGGADYNFNLASKNLTRNGSLVQDFKSDILGNKQGWSDFLWDVLERPIDSTFLETAIEINNNEDLKGFVNVAVATIISAEIQNRARATGNTVKELLEGEFSAVLPEGSKAKVYYEPNLESPRIGGILSSLTGLKALSRTIAANNRDTTKSYVKNAEGNNLPKYRLTSAGNDDIYILNDVKEQAALEPGHPMNSNLFISVDGLLKGTALKTDFTNADNQTKNIFKMQANELLYSQFVFDYLQPRSKNTADRQSNELAGMAAIQPTTYSDKSNIWVKLIDMETKFTYRDIYGNEVFTNKSLGEMSADELNQLRFSTLHGMYESLSRQLLSDYKLLFLGTQLITPSEDGLGLSLTEYNSLSPELKNLFEETEEFIGDSSITTYNYKENLTINDFVPLISKLDETRIYQAILFLQKEGFYIEILPEVHYSKTKKGIQFNTTLLENIKNYSLKNLSNKSTINNIPESYWDKKKAEDKLYALTLKMSGVKFDLYDENGSEIKTLTNNIDMSALQSDFISKLTSKSKQVLYDKLKLTSDEQATYKNIWVDNRTQRLNNFYILKKNGNKYDIVDNIDLMSKSSDPECEVYLNPELNTFKSLDNLVSDNYNTATIGLPFLHPAKGASTNNNASTMDKLIEEAARTTAMYKRGVVVGATIHPFIKGKITGIPDRYKLAVIEDLSTPVFNIQGDSDGAKQFDGGIFLHPMIARYEQNSLEEIEMSPIHRKPLGYFSMSKYLSSGLLKCATFAVTNEYMRNAQSGSIIGNSLMKQMADNLWDIPNLDITVDRNGKRISYNGIIYRDINTLKYWKIRNITKNYKLGFDENGKLNNQYTIERVQLNSKGSPIFINGKEVIEKITKDISSNYDLWMALGGEFSAQLENGQIKYSETSLDKITEVGNLVAFNRNTYNQHPLIMEAKLRGYKIHIPPSSTQEVDVSQNTYYQPMKFSDIAYLATAGAVKNGMANLNPGNLFKNGYNPNIPVLLDSDRIIYGHPTIGKTYLKTTHDSFISFDDDYKSDIDSFIDERLKEGQTRQDYKREAPSEYRQRLLELYEEAKTRANQENKRFFFSDQALLKALDEIGELEQIDKVLNIKEAEFVERSRKRGETNDENTRDWKRGIDTYISKLSDRTIDVGRYYLGDILDNSIKGKQRSSLTYITIKPDYIGIQLNAEHAVDESEVSEMTQVISALEQMSASHELANQVYEDIGRVIAKGLQEYNFDLNSEEDKTRVYKILGRNLLKTFSGGSTDRLGLASAYLDLVKEDILSDKSLSQMQYKIPFDDNNIFGIFTNGFTNGINRDIIKRKYSGLQAILNPSHDIVTIYDNPAGGVWKYTDILDRVSTPEERDAIFRAMDKEVDIGEIRAGDWIQIGRESPVQVMNYRNNKPGQIGLLDLKDLRLTGTTTVKRLGSKGRNLRSANHVLTLADGSASRGIVTFDTYDLDTSRLSWTLNDKKWKTLIESDVNLQIAWNEVVERVNQKFGHTLKLTDNKDIINSYLRDLINEDLMDLSNGRFRIPVAYRTTDSIFANIANDRFDANELAIGKNTASKFGLRVGDSLDEIEAQGPKFFETRQRETIETDISSRNYDMYFVKNNKEHLHIMLNNSPEARAKIELWIKSGMLVEDQSIDKGTVNGNDYVLVDGEIGYKISDEDKFYTYITSSGKSRKVLVTSNLDTLKAIDQSRLYSNVVYNYTGNNIATLFPLQVNSTFTALEDREALENWEEQLKTASSELEKETLAQQINSSSHAALNNRIKKSSQDMFTSWQEAIKFIVARIPSQSMQSFMNMKVAMFTESETNICYVPVEQIWYQGSDFDIDKAFMLGASISNQGTYYNWSPLFNFLNEETLNISHDLPFPSGKRFFSAENGVILEGNYDELLRRTPEEIMNSPKLYRLLVNLVRETTDLPASGNNNVVMIQGLDEDLIELLNQHSLYNLSENDYQEAIKNKIFNALWRIGSDIRNVVSATSPISMGPAQVAADNSTSGQFSKLVSNENPGARIILQYQNSIGKDGIGVYATGIKVFSILLNYYNEKVNSATEDTLGRYTFHNIKGIESNANPDELAKKTGTIDVYDNEGNLIELKESPTLPNIAIKSDINPALLDLAEKVYKRGPQEDVFLTISVLLSAATDNAKELILEKINAGPDLASVYIYLLATGVDFKTASDFMTTRAVTMANNKAKKDILYINGKRNNLKKAVQYYTEMADPDNYIPIIYQQSILDWGERILNKLVKYPEFKSELEELMKSSSNFFEILNKIQNKNLLDVIHEAAYSGADLLKVTKKQRKKKMSREEIENMMNDFDDLNDIAWEQSEYSEEFDIYNPSSKDTRPEKMRLLFSRYIDELKNRRDELNTLTEKDLHNMEVLLDLKERSDELTRLGRFGSLNQGIKTKLVDKINYINQLKSFISGKFKKFNSVNKLKPDDDGYLPTNFDLLNFIQDEDYKQQMIDNYELAKDKFNILDIITSVPHFSKMLTALAVDSKVLGAYTVKNNLAKELTIKALQDRAIIQLTQKDMSEVNRFISDAIIIKFLKSNIVGNISLSPGMKMYNSTGKIVPVSSVGKTLDLGNVFDRATFKLWFEEEFIPDQKRINPNNKFIQALTSTYFKNQYGGFNFLYKLPIDLGNLEVEANEIAFSNYLKAFDEIKYTRPLSSTNMTLGDLFFLYNLIVSKNNFGDNTLTKIFENSLNIKDKNERVEVENSLLLKFMDYEGKLNPALNSDSNGLVEGEDYKYDDLLIRIIKKGEPNGTKFTKEYDPLEKKTVVKETEFGQTSNIEMFLENNTMLMPFLTKGFTKFSTETKNDFISKLVNLISNNKAEVKLTCDE